MAMLGKKAQAEAEELLHLNNEADDLLHAAHMVLKKQKAEAKKVKTTTTDMLGRFTDL